MTDSSGDPIAMAEATVAMAMYTAPALSMDELANVKRLQMGYTDIDGMWTQEMAFVISARKYSDVHVEFIFDCDRKAVIENGEAYIEFESLDYASPLCSSNVSCSAFTASQDEVDAITEAADAALAAINITVDRRRRLEEESCSDQSATCSGWCDSHASSWSAKCSWGSCEGCDGWRQTRARKRLGAGCEA